MRSDAERWLAVKTLPRILGSVPNTITHHATCAVLAVQTDDEA